MKSMRCILFIVLVGAAAPGRAQPAAAVMPLTATSTAPGAGVPLTPGIDGPLTSTDKAEAPTALPSGNLFAPLRPIIEGINKGLAPVDEALAPVSVAVRPLTEPLPTAAPR